MYVQPRRILKGLGYTHVLCLDHVLLGATVLGCLVGRPFSTSIEPGRKGLLGSSFPGAHVLISFRLKRLINVQQSFHQINQKRSFPNRT